MEIKVFGRGDKKQEETIKLKNWLEENEIPFLYIDLDKNPEFFDYVVNKLKFKDVPVIDIGGVVSFTGYVEILLESNKKLMIKLTS